FGNMNRARSQHLGGILLQIVIAGPAEKNRWIDIMAPPPGGEFPRLFDPPVPFRILPAHVILPNDVADMPSVARIGQSYDRWKQPVHGNRHELHRRTREIPAFLT